MRLPICRVSKLLNSLKGAATSRRGVLLFACLLACGCAETVIANDSLFDSVAGTGRPENNGDEGPAATLTLVIHLESKLVQMVRCTLQRCETTAFAGLTLRREN